VSSGVIRVATSDDVPAVVALVESAYRGDASRSGWTTEADLLDGQRTDSAAVHEAMAAGATVLVLEGDDGRLLACCELTPADHVCRFGMFAVDPTRQGDGIGAAMLTAAETHAHDMLAAAEMEMAVIAQRAELIAWYERRGYARTGGTAPFPYGDPRFGLPRRDDLYFVLLRKQL
jgi:ribosomal protein S18 acetylase RimI-like enzyme